MAVIQDKEKEIIKKKLDEGLEGDVKLIMFTQENECQFCADTRVMVEELAGMSPKIEARIHDFVKDEKLAKSYGVKKIPAIVMLGEKDYGTVSRRVTSSNRSRKTWSMCPETGQTCQVM